MHAPRIKTVGFLGTVAALALAVACAFGVARAEKGKGARPGRSAAPLKRVARAKTHAVRSASARTRAEVPAYREGEALVACRRGVTADAARAAARSAKMSVAQDYPFLSQAMGKTCLLVRAPSMTARRLCDTLSRDPRVESASPNYRKKLLRTPNDPAFTEQWALHNTGQSGGTPGADMDAPAAWDITTGSDTVVVADVDTGADYTHPDLAANIWTNPNDPIDGIDNDGNGCVDDYRGWDFARDNEGNNGNDPMDLIIHGTHTAGIIAAAGNNGIGIAGVNWSAKVMLVKGFRPDGYMYESDELEAYQYVLWHKTHGVNIAAVNASYGGGEADEILKGAIRALGDAGVVFCAAAGNDGLSNDAVPQYPASFDLDTIIAVAATDENDRPAPFSNYGPTSVDVGAPGVGVLGTIPGRHIPDAADIFFDDMETANANWAHGGTNDTWAITTDIEGFENPDFPPPSPPHFWSDSPGAEYQPGTDSWLAVADDIDLSGVAGAVYLGFWAAIDIEGDAYDHGYVEVSGDGGTNWTGLFDFSGYSYYGQQYSFRIPDAFKTSQFRFRFRLVSDGGVQYEGWLIDDVGVGTTIQYDYEYWDGTSMSTACASSAVALAAARFPGETAAQRIARVLGSADAVPGLRVLTGGRLNLRTMFDDLQVSPAAAFRPAGPAGGPFTPRATVWTIVNDGAAPLPWTAAGTQPWLNVSPAGGTLGGGASASVTTSVNFAADALIPGEYTDVVTIMNASSGIAHTRSVALGIACGYAEDFEAAWPPDGWSVATLGAGTRWEQSEIHAESGRYGAYCAYTDAHHDERLISGPLDLAAFVNPELRFWWVTSYYWLVDPYSNADLILSISTDGGATWTRLWSEEDEGEFEDWVWYEKAIDLSAYAGEREALLAWQYVGADAADVAIDNVRICGDLPPLVVDVSAAGTGAGEAFSLGATLTSSLTRPFDLYFIADTPYGIYTVFFDGTFRKGIVPLYLNVPGYPAPSAVTVWRDVVVPPGLSGAFAFYLAAVEAGQVPPVASLGDLTAATPRVLAVDRETVTLR